MLVDSSKIELARMYDNSCPLRTYKRSEYSDLVSTFDFILEEMKFYKGLVSLRSSSIKKLKWHIEFFITNLYAVYLRDSTMFVSYSRNQNEYSDKKSKYKVKFNLSYEFSVNKVIWFLLENGYVEGSPWKHDRNDPSKSTQSRMRATKKLIDLIDELQDSPLPHEMIEPDEGEEELIIVKGIKPKPKRVLMEIDGVKKWVTIRSKRKICKTPDTRKVRKMRENVIKINKVMDAAEITLDITDEELKQLNARLRQDRNPNKQAVDFSRKRLHRVFLDRRLDRGGRFYGPWYQNIPKEYREMILINGAPTIEPDFSGYHPRILYALNGLSLPKDPYKFDGYPDNDVMRKFLKTLLLTIMNAKDSQNAIDGMRGHRYDEHKRSMRIYGRKADPIGLEPLTDEKYLEVMDKLMEKHRPIENFFFKELGSYLQYLDSQIAEAIILTFANSGQPCLPVHDSSIVDFRLVFELENLMNILFAQALKQDIKIKDNMDQLFYRGVNKVIESLKEYPKDKERLDKFKQDIEEQVKKTKKFLIEEMGIGEEELNKSREDWIKKHGLDTGK